MKKIFQNKWIILLLILVPNFIITYLTTQTVFLYILDANPNRYVTETLLKVYDQIQRFRILTGTNSTERLLKSCEEHLEIINNLLCSNYQAAAKKMDDHLTASWQATINLVIYNDNGVQPSLRR